MGKTAAKKTLKKIVADKIDQKLGDVVKSLKVKSDKIIKKTNKTIKKTSAKKETPKAHVKKLIVLLTKKLQGTAAKKFNQTSFKKYYQKYPKKSRKFTR